MVEVEIASLDMEKRRISLSMKRVQANPWANAEQKYAVNQFYAGTVSRFTDFGAFVALEAGVDGLVHISEISDKHINRISDVLSQGQEVTVRVLSVDAGNQRIGLSMKGVETAGVDAGQVSDHHETEAAPARPAKTGKPRRGGLDW